MSRNYSDRSVNTRTWVRANRNTPQSDYNEISSDGYQVCRLFTQAGGYIVYTPKGQWIPETASGTIKGAKAYLEKFELEQK